MVEMDTEPPAVKNLMERIQVQFAKHSTWDPHFFNIRILKYNDVKLSINNIKLFVTPI